MTPSIDYSDVHACPDLVFRRRPQWVPQFRYIRCGFSRTLNIYWLGRFVQLHLSRRDCLGNRVGGPWVWW